MGSLRRFGLAALVAAGLWMGCQKDNSPTAPPQHENHPPTVSIYDVSIQENTATIRWDSYEQDLDDRVILFEYSTDLIHPNWQAKTPDGLGRGSLTMQNLSNGTHWIRVKAEDTHGEWGEPDFESFNIDYNGGGGGGGNNQDTTPPNTIITSGPTQDWPHNFAVFHWSGSDNQTSLDDLVYRYMLVGRDNNWSYETSGTMAEYANLENGVYTFKVKAIDQAGNEDPTPAMLTFNVNVDNGGGGGGGTPDYFEAEEITLPDFYWDSQYHGTYTESTGILMDGNIWWWPVGNKLLKIDADSQQLIVEYDLPPGMDNGLPPLVGFNTGTIIEGQILLHGYGGHYYKIYKDYPEAIADDILVDENSPLYGNMSYIEYAPDLGKIYILPDAWDDINHIIVTDRNLNILSSIYANAPDWKIENLHYGRGYFWASASHPQGEDGMPSPVGRILRFTTNFNLNRIFNPDYSSDNSWQGNPYIADVSGNYLWAGTFNSIINHKLYKHYIGD